MRLPEDISEADLANINSTASQNLLRVVRAALREGRLKAPREIPSPPLASRVEEYRQQFRDDADVDVLSTTPDRVMVLVSPKDGLPLFILRFDLESIAPTGRLQ